MKSPSSLLMTVIAALAGAVAMVIELTGAHALAPGFGTGISPWAAGDAQSAPPPQADDRDVTRPIDLPNPVPDIVAMTTAQDPVSTQTVDTSRRIGHPVALGEIRDRERQGDRKEAARLYQEYADGHPGTPEAAIALFEVARISINRPWGRASSPADLARAGAVAFRLADENPAHFLTARALHMYVSEMLEAAGFRAQALRDAERHELSEQEWGPVFRAAAMLAGRFPEDSRGPERLLDIADALALSAESRRRALDLYRFVSEWPCAWDSRFRAYRSLHDDALGRGATDEAESIALTAVKACAGRMAVSRRPRSSRQNGAEHSDTPWARRLSEGVPSQREILLKRPKWAGDEQFAFRVQTFKYEGGDGEWGLAGDTRQPDSGCPVAALLGEGTDGLFAGVASGVSRGLFESRPLELALLGNPELSSPHPASHLFLPRFPVRSGVEIFSCEGTGLVRQEARVEGERVVVSILAGRQTSCEQVWRKGDPWWTSANSEFEAFLPRASMPGPYDDDPGRGMLRIRCSATRIPVPEELPSPVTLLKEALATSSPYEMDQKLRSAMLARLPEHFSGEELNRLQAAYRREAYRSTYKSPQEQAETIDRAAAFLAASDPASALTCLEGHESWWNAYDQARVLRARALHLLGRNQEAEKIAKWLPKAGPFATPESLSVIEQIGAGTDAVDTPPQEPNHLRYQLRLLWRPPEGNRRPYHIQVDRGSAGVSLLLRDAQDSRWRWRIAPDGEELEPPGTIDAHAPSGHGDWIGAGRVVFAHRDDTVFVREADRILAENAAGEELWRYTAPAGRPRLDLRRNLGLPLLAGPTLIRCAQGDRIIYGLGQRYVIMGMAVHIQPIGGGITALDLEGNLDYSIDTGGYCQALQVVQRTDGKHIAVGLFVEPGEGPAFGYELQTYLAGHMVDTGALLWKTPMGTTDRLGPRWWAPRGPLFAAVSDDGSRRVLVSLAKRTRTGDGKPTRATDTVVFDLNGRETVQVEGLRVTLTADLNSDGVDELVAINDAATGRFGVLSILDGAGNTLWQGPEGCWSACGAEDLDGDGFLELLAFRESPCRALAVFGKIP